MAATTGSEEGRTRREREWVGNSPWGPKQSRPVGRGTEGDAGAGGGMGRKGWERRGSDALQHRHDPLGLQRPGGGVAAEHGGEEGGGDGDPEEHEGERRGAGGRRWEPGPKQPDLQEKKSKPNK